METLTVNAKSIYGAALSSPAEIIEQARLGNMVILVDDEDRENEGDLYLPAQWCTAETINFMARYGRGLICLALDQANVDRLHLPLMARHNGSRNQTAFTVSIEAREGITTGISAADRARTVKVAVDPNSGPNDVVSPGHVFPLAAREGGVLVRAGHTEAAVDIARLAGLSPAGVICEIMNDDGTMARLPDLVQFAQYHSIKIGTIADLIAYRRRTETIVVRTLESDFESRFGGAFRMVIYTNTLSGVEHVALIKGDVGGNEPVLVRMHALNVLDDVLYDRAGDHGGLLQEAMRVIGEAGRGVVVLVREPLPGSLSARLRERLGGDEQRGPELRDYGVGAQILLDVGVRRMILLSNSKRTVVGLEGYGLSIVGQQPIATAN